MTKVRLDDLLGIEERYKVYWLSEWMQVWSAPDESFRLRKIQRTHLTDGKIAHDRDLQIVSVNWCMRKFVINPLPLAHHSRVPLWSPSPQKWREIPSWSSPNWISFWDPKVAPLHDSNGFNTNWLMTQFPIGYWNYRKKSRGVLPCDDPRN